MRYKIISAAVFFLFPAHYVFPQDVDISYYLKKIESGKKQEVLRSLPELKKQHPGSASVIYLDALLTEDGTEAVHKYLELSKKYPESNYADDALFRVYAYYYASGSYFAAREYLKRLKKKYPGSPYIKLAESSIPERDETGALPDIEKVSNNKQKVIKENLKYTIQAGAFTHSDNATKLHKDFLLAGYFSEIKEKTVAGTSFKVVYVGQFKTEKEAAEFLNIINAKFRLSGRVFSANQ
jgi:hypothetical protein